MPRLLLIALLLLSGPAFAGRLQDGLTALEAGDNPTALVQLRLALREAQGAGDANAEAACLAGLGRVHRALGRHADAGRYLQEALALDRKRGDRAAVAADLGELGLHARLLGEAEQASKHFRRELELRKELADPAGAADALTNLGLALADGWHLDDAIAAHRAAVGLFETLGDAGGRGDALTNLGIALADAARYAEAIEAGRQALEAFDAAADPRGRSAALHNLGNVYADLGDWPQATQLYRQARAGLSSSEELVAADSALGGVLLAAGDPDGAAAAFEAALGNTSRPADRAGLLLDLGQARTAGGAGAETSFQDAAAAAREAGDRPIECAALIALGRAELSSGGDAVAVFKRAAALADKLALPDLQWRAWFGLGAAARAAGRPGVDELRRAVTLLEEGRRGLQDLDPWVEAAYVRDRKAVYEALVDALLAAGDGASALLYAERMQVAELRPDGAGGDAAEVRYQELAGREAQLLGDIERAERQPEDRRDAERIAALRAQLAQARVAFSRYVDELRRDHPDFDRLVRVDPSDIEAWQRELGPDEVVIQPIVLPDRVALLVFSDGPLLFREVVVDRAELEKRVGRVLRVMRSRRLGNPERLVEHLDQLGQWLWEPIAAELEGRRRVVVVGSGALRYLPFQLLRRRGRYLVQDHEVVRVTNVGSLKRRPGEELRLGAGGLLAIGNPDGSLPAADREVDALAALFPGSRVLHRGEATRQQVTEQANGRAVLHLATHGVLNADAPEQSYIVLAPGEGSEGRLPYLDIPGFYEPLRSTRLVVLSACETAVPLAPQDDAVQGGGLEIAGLANQFRRAGVPRLLASLWQVGDASTERLMVRFYEALGEGRAPPEALAVAQRALLADPEFAHPFHWAPFVLIGTPR